MTYAYELQRLADEISDLEVEARELKHEVFALKTENATLRNTLKNCTYHVSDGPAKSAEAASPDSSTPPFVGDSGADQPKRGKHHGRN